MPKTISLGRRPLSADSMKLAASHFEAWPTPLFPTKLVVPHGSINLGARLLHYHYGDLSIAIQLEWQSVSPSWALVSPELVVMAQWPSHPSAYLQVK